MRQCRGFWGWGYRAAESPWHRISEFARLKSMQFSGIWHFCIAEGRSATPPTTCICGAASRSKHVHLNSVAALEL